MMNVSDTEVLWQGESKSLKSAASGGRLTDCRYRVTRDAVHFEAGILSTKAEMVPLWTVVDADMVQSITQKARNVGDVRLRLDASAARYGQALVTLASIEEPRRVRDIILEQANIIRSEVLDRRFERDIEMRHAGTASINIANEAPDRVPVSPASGAPLVIDQLKDLAALHEAGALTDEEYTAAKAKILNS
jgi:hypothetical protein